MHYILIITTQGDMIMPNKEKFKMTSAQIQALEAARLNDAMANGNGQSPRFNKDAMAPVPGEKSDEDPFLNADPEGMAEAAVASVETTARFRNETQTLRESPTTHEADEEQEHSTHLKKS